MKTMDPVLGTFVFGKNLVTFVSLCHVCRFNGRTLYEFKVLSHRVPWHDDVGPTLEPTMSS